MTNITEAFEAQAQSCAYLGSDFNADLLRLAAQNLHDNHPVGAFLHNWPDLDTFRSGAVALRWTGALHALVLLGMDPELSAVYPPNTPDKTTLWQAVLHAMHRHSDHMIDWMASPPQTNEIRRANALIPAFHLIARETGLPFVLSEIGASMGLNLNWDRFSMEIDGEIWGPETASVALKPDWRGPLPPKADITILERAGCDLNPLDPKNSDDRLRLLSYIWPDQSTRLENTKHAIALAQKTLYVVHKQDALNFLQHRLDPRNGVTRVIYHTIMWQYLSAADQIRGAEMIEKAGQAATPDAPLAWLRVEADQKQDEGAPIMLTLWPGGTVRELGRVDFHGRWVQWN